MDPGGIVGDWLCALESRGHLQLFVINDQRKKTTTT